MSNYRRFRDVLDEALKDPETEAEWNRTQMARDVSTWLLRYRRDHHLTQTALAERLGWKQPVVARLESGDHEPSISTLQRLAERLGTAARIEIEPEDVIHVRFIKRPRRREQTAVAADRVSQFVMVDTGVRELEPV